MEPITRQPLLLCCVSDNIQSLLCINISIWLCVAR